MSFQRARSSENIKYRYDSIINRTQNLFLKNDYNDITLASIAKELNISRPSLYNYFKSKEELFLELLKIEYLDCYNRFNKLKLPCNNIQEFCYTILSTICESPLFIKLLSLHSSALETKCGYEATKKFKLEVLPFFHIIPSLVKKQFPNILSKNSWLFSAQLNILITTIHQYTFIPQEQIDIMMEIKTFGDSPLLVPIDFYTKILIAIINSLI